MKVEIQPIYVKGRSMRSRERATMAKYHGKLQLREERVQELGRLALVAHLISERDGAQSPVLPPLHDACVLYVNGSQLRIRGFELVDEAQYGQTWDVQVQAC
jgi:hypothetical protein